MISQHGMVPGKRWPVAFIAGVRVAGGNRYSPASSSRPTLKKALINSTQSRQKKVSGGGAQAAHHQDGQARLGDEQSPNQANQG